MQRETHHLLMPKLLLIIACVGAFLGIISDCLLLWSSTAYFDIEALSYLGSMPPQNMRLGNFLGVTAIPLEFLALFAFIKPGEKLAGQQLVFIVLALYMLVFGVLFHSHLLIQHEFMAKEIPLAMTLEAMEYYKAMVGLGFATAGLFIVLGIWKQWLRLPRWSILLSPLVTYLFWLILNEVYPPIGNVLLLAGLNLSMLIFFVCSIFLLPNSTKTTA